MTEQPEALRLAYALEAYERAVYHKEAAAELRRLHQEAASLRDQNTELDRKLAEMEQAGRQALKALAWCFRNTVYADPDGTITALRQALGDTNE